MGKIKLEGPAPLTKDHDLGSFDCGEPLLNDWLRRRALINETSGASRTYVVTEGHQVVAYYCLATGAVEGKQAPGRVRRNMPDPIPVIVLGRVAVDKAFQGQGFGLGLLKDALLRVVQASSIIGIRAVLIHAKSEKVKKFYIEKCGFRPSPLDPMTLMVTIEDIKGALNL